MFIEPHLPDSAKLQCRQITFNPERIIIYVQITSSGAICPLCGQASFRIHSRYKRILSDLPWSGTPVELHLEVRRFFCDTWDCPRGIFAERLDKIAPVYARQTIRLIEALRSIGFSLGGEAGSRLATHLGMPTSGDTVLRRIRQAALPEPSLPHVVGLDDWAFRRGYHYGTIVCDLEAHRPIELLADRDSHHVATWLKAHPEVDVISRDRGSDYTHAAAEGAPQAIQVADRWHLVHNLRDSVERILDRHPREIREVAVLLATSGLPVETTPPPRANHDPVPTASSISSRPAVRRDRRRAQYEKVVELHRRGTSYRAIARQLGLHRETVTKYIRAETFPERAARAYPHRTDDVIDVIRRRWDEGCHNAAQLFRELHQMGFTGSYYGIRRRVARWRTEPSGRSPPVNSLTVHSPSSKRIAGWLVMEPQKRTLEDRRFLETLQTQCPEVAKIAPLAETFAGLVRHRESQRLDPWLAQVLNESVPRELKGFAQGLQGDPAVQAALTLGWSNGQVEGQINRLKLIKRQMYGRAGFDLLRQRVLYRG